MLIFTTQAKVAIVLTLLVVWIYQTYKHNHLQHNPLIKTNVITYQNDHRNISRPWDNFDRLANIQSTRKTIKRRTGKTKTAG